MARQYLTPHQRRALSAAAGLVGPPHVRAGLALSLAVACGPLDDPGGESAGDTSTGVASASMGTTSGESLTTGANSSSGATSGGDASSTGWTTGGGSEGSTGGEGTTLLTDASTSLATSGDTTGDMTGTDTTGMTGTTGTLDDCMDPRTGEVDWVCCEAQNWEPFPQCTPWGPPAPPAVDAAALRRAAEARGRWV